MDARHQYIATRVRSRRRLGLPPLAAAAAAARFAAAVAPPPSCACELLAQHHGCTLSSLTYAAGGFFRCGARGRRGRRSVSAGPRRRAAADPVTSARSPIHLLAPNHTPIAAPMPPQPLFPGGGRLPAAGGLRHAHLVLPGECCAGRGAAGADQGPQARAATKRRRRRSSGPNPNAPRSTHCRSPLRWRARTAPPRSCLSPA